MGGHLIIPHNATHPVKYFCTRHS